MAIANDSARDPWYLATTPIETRPWLIRMRWAAVGVDVLLIANAFDATPNVGALVVVDVSATPDIFRVSVADEGPGLTPEALRRAGEPFYTTKEPGRGLGLGLFLARIFAERLGGSLKLESTVGTTAVLELPIKTVPVQAL